MSRKKPTKKRPANKQIIVHAEEQQRNESFKQGIKDAADDITIGKVNWQWREFALGIMNGKMNYRAYADAYGILDVESDKRAYQIAAASAARLLKNVKFRAYWQELLEEQGFNDLVVDSQMLNQITDPLTPPAVKRAAIKDYNELKGRIVKNIDHTSGGEPIPILGLGHNIPKE